MLNLSHFAAVEQKTQFFHTFPSFFIRDFTIFIVFFKR